MKVNRMLDRLLAVLLEEVLELIFSAEMAKILVERRSKFFARGIEWFLEQVSMGVSTLWERNMIYLLGQNLTNEELLIIAKNQLGSFRDLAVEKFMKQGGAVDDVYQYMTYEQKERWS